MATPRMVKCQNCGVIFEARNHAAQYCPACRDERHKETSREYNRQARAAKRVEREEFSTCRRCGGQFTGWLPNRKYCDACIRFVKIENAARYRAKRDPKAPSVLRKDPDNIGKMFKLIYDPSGDFSMGARFDRIALPGSIIETNYTAWPVGTRWTDGQYIYEYKHFGKKVERIA